MTHIESRYSSNRYKHRNFVVTCHLHRIRTIVTATPSVVRYWVFRIRRYHFNRIRSGSMVVGLGVQWTPSFEVGGRNPPATLQLCVGHHCLILHLAHAPRIPLSLRRFLSDPDITFVGVSNRNDDAMLRSSDHMLSVWKLLDLCDVASDVRGYSRKISMERLADLVLGMEGVNKATWVGKSDWDAYWLSEAQIEYACLDAFISFSIGISLEVWNWVEDEHDEDFQQKRKKMKIEY